MPVKIEDGESIALAHLCVAKCSSIMQLDSGRSFGCIGRRHRALLSCSLHQGEQSIGSPPVKKIRCDLTDGSSPFMFSMMSIAAKKSPKVPLQKSPGVGNCKLELLSASLKFPRTCVL